MRIRTYSLAHQLCPGIDVHAASLGLACEMRPFVGTWRLESPSPTSPARPELVDEMDLMINGTKIERAWDPQTGAVAFNQPSPAWWQVSNGRYQEIIPGHDWLHDLAGVGG